ncbi:MAG: hypothetical protein H7067_11970 [Burkholderiales bacterium]|nr:hypothetical protein [Opitutaceae bacterium]
MPGGPASHSITVKASDPAGLFATTTFTINVVGPTYATWRAEVFNASQASLPAFSGMSADPDRDGVPNLLEYTFDLDPLVPNPAGLPVASVVDVGGADYLAVAYTRSKFASDLTYAVESSGDLNTWTSATPVVVSVTDHGDTETVLVRDSVATGGDARRFLRVRMTVTS